MEVMARKAVVQESRFREVVMHKVKMGSERLPSGMEQWSRGLALSFPEARNSENLRETARNSENSREEVQRQRNGSENLREFVRKCETGVMRDE